MSFVETSALDATNVEDAFKMIITHIYKLTVEENNYDSAEAEKKRAFEGKSAVSEDESEGNPYSLGKPQNNYRQNKAMRLSKEGASPAA